MAKKALQKLYKNMISEQSVSAWGSKVPFEVYQSVIYHDTMGRHIGFINSIWYHILRIVAHLDEMEFDTISHRKYMAIYIYIYSCLATIEENILCNAVPSNAGHSCISASLRRMFSIIILLIRAEVHIFNKHKAFHGDVQRITISIPVARHIFCTTTSDWTWLGSLCTSEQHIAYLREKISRLNILRTLVDFWFDDTQPFHSVHLVMQRLLRYHTAILTEESSIANETRSLYYF